MPYLAYDKDPDAVEEVVLDWTTYLGSDTIATSTWPVTPSGIASDFSNTTTTATVLLSGGTAGQSYDFINRVTTNGPPSRTYDWELIVRVYSRSNVPVGPPFAAIVEHVSYTPQAEGEEAFKIEMVAADAADIVQSLVPQPNAVESVLSASMDATQDTIPIVAPYPNSFPEQGEVLIDNELLSYSGYMGYMTATPSAGSLTNALRGRSATTPATHASGAAIKEVGYVLRARRAELAVFEWLWLTRGWRPTRSGVLGSESYLVGDEVKGIVRQVMGPYYGRKGGGIRRAVAMTSFPNRRGSIMDWQKGWYDVWP